MLMEEVQLYMKDPNDNMTFPGYKLW